MNAQKLFDFESKIKEAVVSDICGC